MLLKRNERRNQTDTESGCLRDRARARSLHVGYLDGPTSPVRHEPADDESNLPRTGIKIVLGTVIGIFVVLRLVGLAWSLYALGL